jgi:hypothetical protein
MFSEQNMTICCGGGDFWTSRALIQAGNAENRDDPPKQLIICPYSSPENA